MLFHRSALREKENIRTELLLRIINIFHINRYKTIIGVCDGHRREFFQSHSVCGKCVIQSSYYHIISYGFSIMLLCCRYILLGLIEASIVLVVILGNNSVFLVTTVVSVGSLECGSVCASFSTLNGKT